MVSRAHKQAERLGDILIRTTGLDSFTLERALMDAKRSGRRIGEVLVESGDCTPLEVAQALADQLHIPFRELDQEFRLNQEDVKLLPESIARRYGMFCISSGEGDGRTIDLVMHDPTNLEALDAVRALHHLDIQKNIGLANRISEIIDQFYREETYIEENLQTLVDLEEGDLSSTGSENLEADQLKIMANDAPVIRFVNLLLMEAVRDRASDIHFEPGEYRISVRLRIDGRLRKATPPPKTLYNAVVTRLKILSRMDIAERRLPQDGRFKYLTQGHEVDVRVSSLPEIHGEKVVLRILDRTGLNLDMEKIGFESVHLQRFKEILKMPHGIILLTGPTGSGKTSTLYSALNYLMNPELNIQTVEDPVEYHLEGINQMSVQSRISLDFASALRAILRQDPDIIMIGEIRDLETAEIAIRAALTGHLVLSTLHTNDATSAFSRLVDIGVKPYLIAATVKLVISQRLARKVCPECQETYQLPDEQMQLLIKADPEAHTWEFQRGAGCKDCRNTGYWGRLAVSEFLEVSRPIMEMVQRGAGDLEIRQAAIDGGMDTMVENGLCKIRRGETTMDELMSVWPIDEQAFSHGENHAGI